MTYWEDVSEEATTTDKQAADKRKIADAAGQVRVAQAKLDEIRNKENATDSQRLAAEEKLAAAQRRRAAAEHDAAATSDDTPDDKPGRPSAATQLVELALDRYHFGVTEDGQPSPSNPVGMLCGCSAAAKTHYAQNYRKSSTNRTRSPAATGVGRCAARARGHGRKTKTPTKSI
jgi:hypothetical protein